MKRLSLRLALLAFASAALLLAVCRSNADDAASNSCACATAKDLLGVDNPPDSPVRIDLKLIGASLKDGVNLRVEIANIGSNGYSLSVCPSMGLCCVEGLHPLLAYDDTGMGLLDLCKDRKPSRHETFLPAGAAFCFDLSIPSNRLPEAARKENKEISLLLCFELGNNKLLHSNVVKTVLR